jgi:hypothetical protein
MITYELWNVYGDRTGVVFEFSDETRNDFLTALTGHELLDEKQIAIAMDKWHEIDPKRTLVEHIVCFIQDNTGKDESRLTTVTAKECEKYFRGFELMTKYDTP